jgi:hypothetical protein
MLQYHRGDEWINFILGRGMIVPIQDYLKKVDMETSKSNLQRFR